jgi:hypothetical protein
MLSLYYSQKKGGRTEMWRSKKFVVVVLVAAVLIVGSSIGGVVFAQTASGDESQPKARCGDMLGRVCEIYEQETGVTIDQEALKDAFSQAQSEMRPEAMKNRFEMRPQALQNRPEMGPEAMQNHLQNLVDKGKITQEQADALQEWWGARPDVTVGFGFPGGHGGFHPAPGMGGLYAPAE